MKKATILIILLTIISTINGMEFCGIKSGLYLDVKTSVYKIYKPLETITNDYVQIDSNRDFEIFTPELVQINNQMVTACNQSNSSYCD